MPNLAEKEYCTGCTACASVCPKGCITMAADENGFLCPVVDTESCVACGLCEKTCPVINPAKTANMEPKAYAAYSGDETVRMQSSSGGVFSEIAKVILDKGGAVFGAAYNEQFEVVHVCAEHEGDLARLRGAKYAQSDLGDTFSRVKQRLDRGQQVLFSGTPCQVAGLKAFLPREYENLLTVDFVCHSVPSPMAWREYVRYRAQQDNGGTLPEKINLRAKHTGWSRYQYSNLFRYANGVSYTAKSGDSLYMKLFVGGYINRESCENCRFKGYNRVSDLTLGDFWGIWDVAPEIDDNKGTSVMLVQSTRGAEVLAQIGSRLVLKEVSLEEASRENQAMLKTAALNERRPEALALIRAGSLGDCKTWFAAPKPTFARRLLRKMKAILGRGL